MTDFERKSGQESGRDGAQGDPLLELTQLFGTHSRRMDVAASAVEQEPEQEERPDWNPTLTTQPAGISMSGNIVLGGYGAMAGAAFPTASPESGFPPRDEVAIPHEEEPPAFIEATVANEGQEDWTDPFWEETQSNPDSNEADETSWLSLGKTSDPYWEDKVLEDLPDADHDHHEEQIFHALEGDLTDAASEVAADSRSLPAQNEESLGSLPSSDLSGGYFGYGQSVQINVSSPVARVFAKAQASPLIQEAPSLQKQEQPPTRPQERPQEQPLPPQSASLAEPPEFLSDFSHSEAAAQAFAETLHDFDLTIHKEKRRRTRRDPIMTELKPTERFELPSLDHDPLPPLPSEHDFDLAVEPRSVAGENNFFASATPTRRRVDPKPDHAVAGEEYAFDASNHGLYDWNAATQTERKVPQTGKRRNKTYALFIALLLAGLAGGGYWFYDFYQAGMMQSVLIRADPTAVKIKPEASDESQTIIQDTAIYRQDTADSSPGSQDALRDGSETPLNVDLLTPPPVIRQDETAASSRLQENASLLPADVTPVDMEDLDPVDASILAAIGRALPVHIVPTVTIHRDRDGNISDIPHKNEAEEIVVPAGEYQTRILQQLALGERGGINHGNTQRDMNAETTSLPDQMSDQQNPQPIEAARNVSDAISSPISSDVRGSQEGSTPPAQETASSDLINDEATGFSLANIPAVIPEKPIVPQRQVEAPSAQPEQQQDTAAPNRVTDSMVDERFYVQVSSQTSQQAAIESAEEVGQRFASLVGRNQIVIVPADIPGRGMYYRVRILVPERSDAVQLCEQYQAAGGSCFVGR